MSNQDRAEGAYPARFACGGPEGTFWTNDSELANKLIRATFDRDDWTVTDMTNPTGDAPQAPGADTAVGRGELPRTFLRMTGTMVEADFDKNTITFEMEGDYVAAAGKYSIIQAAAHPAESSGGDAVDALRKYHDAIQLDADRYRFLRDDAQYSEGWVPHVLTRAHHGGHAPEYLAEEELDAAIDAAIASGGECGG